MTDARSKSSASAVIATTTAVYALLQIVSGFPQIVDPFVRYDDFPALLLLPELFYEKTLAEGRWINYWWHLRPLETPAWLNWQVFLLGWAAFSAAAALHALGNDRRLNTVLLAMLISLAPQAALISLWFNTLIPSVWLIAAYAWITLFLRPLASRLLMLLFVPLSLATYSTFPLLMLAICLIRRDRQKSILDLLGLVLLFGTALGLGLLVIYSGNYLAHGVFGLELADWREPSKARSLAGYVENLRLVPTYFALFFEMMGFGRSGTSWVNLSLFAVSLGLVSRHRPMDALYIGAGVAAGLGLLMLHTVQEGVIIPFRSTHFLWLLFAVTLFRAATVLGRNSSRTASLALVVSFGVVLTSTLHVRNYYQSFQKWQAETRTIASQIPFDDGKIYVQGSYLTVPGAHEAEIFHERAIAFRLHSLSGMGVILCSENPRTCQDKQIPTSFETPASGWTVLTEGTESYLLIEPSEQEQ